MAKTKTVKVVLDGDAKGLSAAMQKAVKESQGAAKDIQGAFNKVDGGGFLDRFALKAKQIKRENRQAGENAFESLLGSPGNGLLELAGGGVKAMMAQFAFKSMEAGAKRVQADIKRLASGEANGFDIAGDAVSAIPLIGQGWSAGRAIHNAAFDTLAYLTGNKENASYETQLEGRQKAEAIQDRTNEISNVYQRGRRLLDLTIPVERKIQEVENKYTKLREDSQKRIREINNSELDDSQKNSAVMAEQQLQKLYTQDKTKENALIQRDLRFDQRAVSGGLLGGASSVIGQYQSLSGGNTFQAQRLQKLFGALSFSNQMTQQIQSILQGDASEGQKNAARGLQSEVNKITDYMTGSKYLDEHPYIPLQYAAAMDVGSSYSGAAQVGMQKDLAENSATATEHAKMTADACIAMERILTEMFKLAQSTGVPVLGVN